MNIKEFKLALVLAAACVVSVHGQATIPYSEGFDNIAINTAPSASVWKNPVDEIYVTDSPAAKDGTAKILYSGGITFDVTADGNPQVWWSAYVEVEPQSEAVAIGDDAAAFYVSDAGDLVAFNEDAVDNWETLTGDVPTDGWVRFAVHLDYNSKTYDIYMSTGVHGSTLAKQNGNPLAMRSGFGGTELAEIEIQGITKLDTVTLAQGEAIVAETESPANAGVTASVTDLVQPSNLLSGANLRYYGSSGFGDALGSMLDSGEKVSIYSGGSWTDYTWGGGSGWSPAFPSTLAPTDGIRITTSASLTINDITAFASETTYDATESIDQHWNLLSVPFGAASRTVASMKISPVTGDMIAVNTSGANFAILRYNSGAWYPSYLRNTLIEPGVAFWYYRNSGTAATWTID